MQHPSIEFKYCRYVGKDNGRQFNYDIGVVPRVIYQNQLESFETVVKGCLKAVAYNNRKSWIPVSVLDQMSNGDLSEIDLSEDKNFSYPPVE